MFQSRYVDEDISCCLRVRKKFSREWDTAEWYKGSLLRGMAAIPGGDSDGAEGGSMGNLIKLIALIAAITLGYVAYQRKERKSQARGAS